MKRAILTALGLILATAAVLRSQGLSTSSPAPVEIVPATASGAAVSSSTKSSLTSSVNVKASSGNVYGLYALNGAASVCWVEFINSSGAGSLGSGVTFSVPLPASTTSPIWIPLHYPVNFSSGIAVGIASAAGGSSACGTAGNVVVFYQ